MGSSSSIDRPALYMPMQPEVPLENKPAIQFRNQAVPSEHKVSRPEHKASREIPFQNHRPAQNAGSNPAFKGPKAFR